MKIAVVCDSGSGLTKQDAKEKGIYFLPLLIVDEDKTYLDGVNTTIEDIFALLKEGKMLKTSLPPIGQIEALFKDLKTNGYEHIICSSLTSGLSSTMQSIMIAAEEVGIPITCMETYSTCHIQKYIALAAKQLVDEGLELNVIIKRLQESINHSGTLIIPDDLDHLKRGGRLTPLAATLGGMLKIKPILKLDESSLGKIDTFAKVRTMSKAMQTAVEAFDDVGIDENYEIVILHTDAEETALQMKEIYFSKYPKSSKIFGYIGAVISVHTGIGCVGIQYIKKV